MTPWPCTPKFPERLALLQELNWDVLMSVTTVPAALGPVTIRSISLEFPPPTISPSRVTLGPPVVTPKGPVAVEGLTNGSDIDIVTLQSLLTLYVPISVFVVRLPTSGAPYKLPAPSANSRPMTEKAFGFRRPATKLP